MIRKGMEMGKMKKKRFENMGTIFSFTFRQGAKGGAFVFITYVMPLLLFLVFFLINVLVAWDSGKEVEPSVIGTVYVLDDTGLDLLGDMMTDYIDSEYFSNLKINSVHGGKAEDILKKIGPEDTVSFLLHAQLSEDEKGVTYFRITAILPEQCDVPEEEYMELLFNAESCMEVIKISTAGINMQNLMYLNSYVQSEVVQAGEQPDTIGEMIAKILAPMIFMLVLYMMLLMYGQSIGKVVVAEKTSKLMEMILTSVRAEALIGGKILAMTALALMQIFLWIVGGVLGFVAGDYVAGQINPDYVNLVKEVIKLMAGENGAAFSVLAVALSVIAICVGFLFYCVFAGLIASCIGKPEEVAKGMGTYNLFVIIGFMAAYFIAMMENATLSRVVRIVPFSSAFALPADILVGNAGLLEGGLCLGLLTAITAVLIVITAKVYRDKVFYTGTNVLERGMKFIAGRH